jgi:hypothetical protein
MSFKMNWNGEEVARRFAEQAVNANIGRLEERIRRDVSALRCPVHQHAPTVLSVTPKGNRLVTHVSACCEEMKDKAERIAAGAE